jgi:hypothetical protein
MEYFAGIYVSSEQAACAWWMDDVDANAAEFFCAANDHSRLAAAAMRAKVFGRDRRGPIRYRKWWRGDAI